jgi:putative oxidoreductase
MNYQSDGTSATPRVHLMRRQRLATLRATLSEITRFAERPIGSLTDLLLRLWFGQMFLVSGLLKVADWDRARLLSANEYPVAWMDSVTAAYLGAGIELIGAVLLMLGLATRAAAVALGVLALVVQLNYRALDAHLFWMAFFGWYALRGAGPLSLDHLLARGLVESPLPFAKSIIHALTWMREHLFPVYQFLLRAWLGITLLATVSAVDPESARALPIATAPFWLFAAQLVLGVLLVLGVGTRLISFAAALAFAATGMFATSGQGSAYWFAAFASLACFGAGRWSIDALLAALFKRLWPDDAMARAQGHLPRVVIVGAGFGGLACAHALRHAPVAITLIDKRNYHLFQPLLYQVATASLSPGDIAAPVRGVFREQANARVLLGNVTGVDTADRQVLLGAARLPYDYLVLATGAAHSYFGRDEWEPYAPGLKTVEDATEVRRRVLLAFEQAEATDDEAARRALLTFLIVGAGPTGVELAGAIAELARLGMEKDFRRFDPAQARILLVQAGLRILPAFPEKLSATAKRSLEKLGVEVLLDSRVELINDDGVVVKGERIAARTVIWAAGVVASPAAKWLGAAADSAGRVKVAQDLSVAQLPNVFAIGDTALSTGWVGKAVPGLAPAAKQGGIFVARVISSRVLDKSAPNAFVYHHLGSLATIGRKAAVADFGFLRLSGAPAWWLWGLIHIGFLVGVRNRISVMWDWCWAYLTLRSGTRLITGGPKEQASPPQRELDAEAAPQRTRLQPANAA